MFDHRKQTALVHLRAAQSQFLETDDAIIREHVASAIELLSGPADKPDIHDRNWRVENDVEEGAVS